MSLTYRKSLKKIRKRDENLSSDYFMIKKTNKNKRIELKKAVVKSNIDTKLLDQVICSVIKERKNQKG